MFQNLSGRAECCQAQKDWTSWWKTSEKINEGCNFCRKPGQFYCNHQDNEKTFQQLSQVFTMWLIVFATPSVSNGEENKIICLCWVCLPADLKKMHQFPPKLLHLVEFSPPFWTPTWWCGAVVVSSSSSLKFLTLGTSWCSSLRCNTSCDTAAECLLPCS